MKAFHFTIKLAHYRTGEAMNRIVGTVCAKDEAEAYEKLNKEFNGDCYYNLWVADATDEIVYSTHPL